MAEKVRGFQKLIGLKVVAVRGVTNKDRRIKRVPVEFLLFSDQKTFIEFTEQDYCSYHDCASYARQVEVRESKERFEQLTMSPYADSTDYDF